MPRQTKLERFEDFVRQAYTGDLGGASSCVSRSDENTPTSSQGGGSPTDLELDQGPHRLQVSPLRRPAVPPGSPRPRSPYRSPRPDRGATAYAGALSVETRARRSPNPGDGRCSATTPPGLNSPLPVRRPQELDLPRCSRLSAYLADIPLAAALEEETHYRVRSFSTSSKGVVNRGDALRSRTASATSASSVATSGSDSSPSGTPSLHSQDDGSLVDCASAVEQLPPMYKVLVIGASNVGKMSLTRQFMTSEYMGHVDTCVGGQDRRVNVLLDSEEAALMFITISPEEDYLWHDDADAYVVVYSTSDAASYQLVSGLLEDIRHDISKTTAIILVANKADIVRNRVISESDGRRLATRYNAKHIEVSALLNHRVDELLAGILSQIKLTHRRNQKARMHTNTESWFLKRAMRGITRALQKHPFHFRSCENLMRL